MKWIKKHGFVLIFVVILIIGAGLLLYPTVSNYWNSFHQSRAIASYAEEVANMDDEEYERMLSEAEAYNEELAQKGYLNFQLSAEELEKYDSVLDVTGTGIMGYIEIDKIHCSLPIYHGTDEAILQIAVGHIQGSSLPVGGASTRTILSGHRGLPSARLFTDLDKMEIGDTFVIRVMDEILTYEVDQILIVLPEETSSLTIEEGQDLCTLVTCTPYGVNSHRLLVTGHRVENQSGSTKIRVTADAMQIEPIMVAPCVAAPVLLVILIVVFVNARKRKRHNQTYEKAKKGGATDGRQE